MTILDDLLAAASDYAAEAVITQDSWCRALVEGWQQDRSIGWAVMAAANCEGICATHEIWARLIGQCGKLTPALSDFSAMHGSIRVWIANHARYANDALWDGKMDAALKLLKKGGTRPDARRKTRDAARREIHKAQNSGLYVGSRKNDKRHDWKTVK